MSVVKRDTRDSHPKFIMNSLIRYKNLLTYEFKPLIELIRAYISNTFKTFIHLIRFLKRPSFSMYAHRKEILPLEYSKLTGRDVEEKEE